jgi:Ran GTPase-activating protein (RanGAP) involved in mRNA processing and transport
MTCLTKNTSLISLNLGKNNLKNSTGRVMVQSMKHNETLQVLNVENNEIIPTLIEQVVKTL